MDDFAVVSEVGRGVIGGREWGSSSRWCAIMMHLRGSRKLASAVARVRSFKRGTLKCLQLKRAGVAVG